MKVLFVGDGWLGSNARSFADGFALAGHDVLLIDTTQVSRPQRGSRDWIIAKASGQRSKSSRDKVLTEIRDARDALNFDMAFCFKTIHIDQAPLLDALDGIPYRVHYSADDVSNSYNTTPDYLRHEGDWDLVVTTKTHNLDEIRTRSGVQVLYLWSAYDPNWHHLSARRETGLFDVGFIGNRRPDRELLMTQLATAYRSNMAISGPGWSELGELKRSGAQLLRSAYGEEFSQLVARTRANLVLLNSENRDKHTCRSFEVPAAGGLVVGERTSEHEQLFGDDKAAILFSEHDELVSQLEWISKNPLAARDIAHRGHEIIISGNHTYADRAKQVVDYLEAQ